MKGHPRVGGETLQAMRARHQDEGPSPRGRGNRRHIHPGAGIVGAIPAWAGKPSCRNHAACRWAGHPRVGGETSPSFLVAIRNPGAIPAWAGKPLCTRLKLLLQTGHPRVGGETARR